MISRRKNMFIIFIFIFSMAFSKEIYVGDKVSLNIKNASRDKIEEAFRDYHIDKIEKSKNGYNISFRTFKVGDNIINIGENKIILKVKSSITEKDKNIYMDLSDGGNKIVENVRFPIFTMLSGILGMMAIIFSVFKICKRKKIKKIISSEENFKIKMDNLSEERFHFEISLALREYIDSKYNSNFLAGTYKKIGKIDEEDIKFIKSLDYYKFSKDKLKEGSLYKEKALGIFNKINEKGVKENV
ncbi:hypothetical protein [Fusobacterium sp. MFO224]|uniref:hypothetical protein n=1 Tax=Fusobacterium sp. MFO224 TaxID=3378070 RepID=UPI003852D66D